MRDFFGDNFLLYRAFGCAVDQSAFNRKYEALPGEKQDRLSCVAVRLWMTLQLRYCFQYETNLSLRGQDWLRLTYREKPSLEIYLLATCLDTLAGKLSKPKDFDDWLEKQAITEEMNKAQVVEQFRMWRQEYGVNQTLKDLFDSLPKEVITWLSVYVRFHKYSGTATLNRKLFKYIFDKWRHPFTHRSATNDTWETDIELPPSEDRWWTYSPDGYLECCCGLDIATMLRVVIYAVALTQLGFKVTEKHLDTYVKALSKLDAFYKFKWEMHHNVKVLRFWANYDESPMILDPLSLEQVQRLNSKLKVSTIAMERELSTVLTLYEGALKEINLQVADFDAAHPREPFEIPDTYRQALREFLAQQITTEAYQAVLQFPQNSQVISIDLFIRDVFLYWAN